MLYIRKVLDQSTKYFDEPSEKVANFIFIILFAWIVYYISYTVSPCSFKIDKELLNDRDPTALDIGWFSVFASFGFYLGEIVPKTGLMRLFLLIQVISTWYVMLS